MRGEGAGSRPAGLPLSAIATVRRGASGPSPISFRLHRGKNLPEIKSCKTLSPPQQRLFWNKSSICELEGEGGAMMTLQAICFGAMLAWTPSLVILALLLHEAPLDVL